MAKPTTQFIDSASAPKSALEKLKEEVKTISEHSKGVQKERTNFVRLNMQKNYKPVVRGGAFTNKIMAKKRNVLKFRENFKRKMQIERHKNRDQVNAYGGLGKVGLDHEGGADDNEEELAPGFSESAMRYVKDIIKQDEEEEGEDEDDDLLDDKDVKEELDRAAEEIISEESEIMEEGEPNFDRPLYKRIPQSEQEYLAILKERFGHSSFKEGQLEALKILLEKKQNALVVLATGGGKSLVY